MLAFSDPHVQFFSCVSYEVQHDLANLLVWAADDCSSAGVGSRAVQHVLANLLVWAADDCAPAGAGI